MGLGDLAPVAIAFVFIAVVLGVGSVVLDDVRANQGYGLAGCNLTNQASCGYDVNATSEGLQGVGELGSWLPTIALVIAAAIVIGVLAFFRA